MLDNDETSIEVKKDEPKKDELKKDEPKKDELKKDKPYTINYSNQNPSKSTASDQKPFEQLSEGDDEIRYISGLCGGKSPSDVITELAKLPNAESTIYQFTKFIQDMVTSWRELHDPQCIKKKAKAQKVAKHAQKVAKKQAKRNQKIDDKIRLTNIKIAAKKEKHNMELARFEAEQKHSEAAIVQADRYAILYRQELRADYEFELKKNIIMRAMNDPLDRSLFLAVSMFGRSNPADCLNHICSFLKKGMNPNTNIQKELASALKEKDELVQQLKDLLQTGC